MDHRKKRICVAKILSAHGIKGLVKIKSFTEDPLLFNQYGSLYNDLDEEVKLSVISNNHDIILASISEITDRNAAEQIAKINLYIHRNALPPPKQDEFYIEDLVGMQVKDKDDNIHGKIIYIHNFGGGNIIEIEFKDKHTEMFVFTKDNFPDINFKDNFIKTTIF